MIQYTRPGCDFPYTCVPVQSTSSTKKEPPHRALSDNAAALCHYFCCLLPVPFAVPFAVSSVFLQIPIPSDGFSVRRDFRQPAGLSADSLAHAALISYLDQLGIAVPCGALPVDLQVFAVKLDLI